MAGRALSRREDAEEQGGVLKSAAISLLPILAYCVAQSDGGRLVLSPAELVLPDGRLDFRTDDDGALVLTFVPRRLGAVRS